MKEAEAFGGLGGTAGAGGHCETLLGHYGELEALQQTKGTEGF